MPKSWFSNLAGSFVPFALSKPGNADCRPNEGHCDSVDMDYGCDGSGSDTRSEVASSFRGDFGYTSTNFAGYNYNTMESEIGSTRPAI